MVMETVTRKKLIFVAGSGHGDLAQAIAADLEIGLTSVELSNFANGEIYCRYGENIRGGDVFVIQSHSTAPDGGDSVNDRLMEQLIMIDAAKRA